MRVLIFPLLLASSLAALAAADPALPSTVTYLLGGIMSGPYRLTVDLETGRLSEAKPAASVHGDGAKVSAADLPETAGRALTPAERDTLRVLAAPVWRDGAARRACMEFSLDALIQLSITVGGVERSSDAPSQCLTSDAVALQRAMLCAANPGVGCS